MGICRTHCAHTLGNIRGIRCLCVQYLCLHKVVLLAHKCFVCPDAQLPPLIMGIPHGSFRSVRIETSDYTHHCCLETHPHTYSPWILAGWQPFAPRNSMISQVLFGLILYLEHRHFNCVYTLPICSLVPTILLNLCFMHTAMWSHVTGHIC